jgi:hypothetical protein
MAWIAVTTDDGQPVWKERALSEAFASDHFRASLADRLGWAVNDAEELERGPDADVISLRARRAPADRLPSAA